MKLERSETMMTKSAASPRPTRRQVTLERTFKAPLQDVWELWTTKAGIESWWGPDGFRVEVERIELRPGGELHYSMITTGAEQIEYMKKAGMPLTTRCRATYTEVTPMTRVAYLHVADFIPGVEPYDVAHAIELFPSGDGVRMLLRIEAMHDDHWTGQAVAGWENELDTLAKVLAGGKKL
jgi:uncharacterized protein YndB with AHSA1/START domain